MQVRMLSWDPPSETCEGPGWTARRPSLSLDII